MMMMSTNLRGAQIEGALSEDLGVKSYQMIQMHFKKNCTYKNQNCQQFCNFGLKYIFILSSIVVFPLSFSLLIISKFMLDEMFQCNASNSYI